MKGTQGYVPPPSYQEAVLGAVVSRVDIAGRRQRNSQNLVFSHIGRGFRSNGT
jgi:hypothetical protein